MEKNELYARILCGEVTVDGSVIRDPKLPIAPTAGIAFNPRRYVSRGGEKLEYPLLTWNIEAAGKVWLDAGSSTGGFTDCLLSFGASAVHAVDVGSNQIDYRLRNDDRVILHEKTNIMKIDRLSPVPHMAVADLSFRSIVGAAEHIVGLTSLKFLIALVKPQFEIRQPRPDFKGIVREADKQKAILEGILRELSERGVSVHAVLPSPITGRKGNREFFFLVRGGEFVGEAPGKEHAVQDGSGALNGAGLLDGIF